MGFARSLGLYDGMVVTSLGQQGSMLEAVYTIPDNICITGGTIGGGGGAFLPCGVTTALFDEVGAAAYLLWHMNLLGPMFSARFHFNREST